MYLAHHGVKGMRWGVRRYRNKDGTRTPKGKKRERQGDNGHKKKMSTKKKLAIAGGIAAGAALAGAGGYAAYKLKPVAVTEPRIVGYGARGKALWGNVTTTMPRYQAEKVGKVSKKVVNFKAERKKVVAKNAHKSVDEMMKQMNKDIDSITAQLLRKNASGLSSSGAGHKTLSQMTMNDLKKLDLY